MKRLCVILSMLVAPLALAQNPVPSEFPAEAAALPAEALKEKLSGNVFAVKLADGGSWRLDYKSNGYFFVNTGSGGKASGTWRTEDGKVCSQLRGGDASCNEVREHRDLLYLKRDSGEVIALTKQ